MRRRVAMTTRRVAMTTPDSARLAGQPSSDKQPSEVLVGNSRTERVGVCEEAVGGDKGRDGDGKGGGCETVGRGGDEVGKESGGVAKGGSEKEAKGGSVEEESEKEARRLEMFSDVANSIPERRTGESATDFFLRVRQLQAECALEHLRSTNAGINSTNSVVAPAQSPQTSPLESPGPKYITTTRSLMEGGVGGKGSPVVGDEGQLGNAAGGHESEYDYTGLSDSVESDCSVDLESGPPRSPCYEYRHRDPIITALKPMTAVELRGIHNKPSNQQPVGVTDALRPFWGEGQESRQWEHVQMAARLVIRWKRDRQRYQKKLHLKPLVTSEAVGEGVEGDSGSSPSHGVRCETPHSDCSRCGSRYGECPGGSKECGRTRAAKEKAVAARAERERAVVGGAGAMAGGAGTELEAGTSLVGTGVTCPRCARGEGTVAAHICRHLLCPECYFNVPGEDMTDRNYCGLMLRQCLVGEGQAQVPLRVVVATEQAQCKSGLLGGVGWGDAKKRFSTQFSLRVYECDDDNFCFFRAIANGQRVVVGNYTAMTSEEVLEWKCELVHWMDENRRTWSTFSQTVNGVCLSFGVAEAVQDAHIARMHHEEFWGGEEEALAASVFLKTSIVTLDPSSEQATLYEYKANSLRCVVSVCSLGELDARFLGLDGGVYSRVVVCFLRKRHTWGMAHYNLFHPSSVKFVDAVKRRSTRKQPERPREEQSGGEEVTAAWLCEPLAALGIEVPGVGTGEREQPRAGETAKGGGCQWQGGASTGGYGDGLVECNEKSIFGHLVYVHRGPVRRASALRINYDTLQHLVGLGLLPLYTTPSGFPVYSQQRIDELLDPNALLNVPACPNGSAMPVSGKEVVFYDVGGISGDEALMFRIGMRTSLADLRADLGDSWLDAKLAPGAWLDGGEDAEEAAFMLDERWDPPGSRMITGAAGRGSPTADFFIRVLSTARRGYDVVAVDFDPTEVQTPPMWYRGRTWFRALSDHPCGGPTLAYWSLAVDQKALGLVARRQEDGLPIMEEGALGAGVVGHESRTFSIRVLSTSERGYDLVRVWKLKRLDDGAPAGFRRVGTGRWSWSMWVGGATSPPHPVHLSCAFSCGYYVATALDSFKLS